MLDNGPQCCSGGDCCGPGSYCCARTGPHEHQELALDRVRALAEKMLDEQGQSWNSISGRRIMNALEGKS